MRRRRTTSHENGVRQAGSGGGSVPCGTSMRGGRLLKGRFNSVTTQIPQTRLTRAGKGITFCRTWKQEGRMTVSATDLRRSNRLPWRRYGNPGGARLWTGCAPGHGGGLLVDCSERRQSAEAGADLRHHNTRTAQHARMVAVPRLHPCGYGKHGGFIGNRSTQS